MPPDLPPPLRPSRNVLDPPASASPPDGLPLSVYPSHGPYQSYDANPIGIAALSLPAPIPSSAYPHYHVSSGYTPGSSHDPFMMPGLPASQQQQYRPRKRSYHDDDVVRADDASSAKRSRSSRTYSDSSREFDKGTGDRLASIYGRRACWVCGVDARPPEKAHVFPKKDPNVPLPLCAPVPANGGHSLRAFATSAS